MKLTTPQIEAVEDQLQATVISESANIMSELRGLYGEHTFIVDTDGLHILEWFPEDQPSDGGEVLSAVQIAAWTDETKRSVATHEPQKTAKQVITGGGPSDGAA